MTIERIVVACQPCLSEFGAVMAPARERLEAAFPRSGRY